MGGRLGWLVSVAVVVAVVVGKLRLDGDEAGYCGGINDGLSPLLSSDFEVAPPALGLLRAGWIEVGEVTNPAIFQPRRTLFWCTGLRRQHLKCARARTSCRGCRGCTAFCDRDLVAD
jgi:hypothetical protein